MTRPNRIHLGAHTIPVKWHDGLVVCDNETGATSVTDKGDWGVCHLGRGGLSFGVSTHHFDPPSNLLHECVHAIFETGGAGRVFTCHDDEEVVIEAVSHGVIELLRRNKGLAEYLISGD